MNATHNELSMAVCVCACVCVCEKQMYVGSCSTLSLSLSAGENLWCKNIVPNYGDLIAAVPSLPNGLGANQRIISNVSVSSVCCVCMCVLLHIDYYPFLTLSPCLSDYNSSPAFTLLKANFIRDMFWRSLKSESLLEKFRGKKTGAKSFDTAHVLSTDSQTPMTHPPTLTHPPPPTHTPHLHSWSFLSGFTPQSGRIGQRPLV